MNDTRRMTSIARRINRSSLLRMVQMMVSFNFLVLVLAVFIFCYQAEKTTLGKEWTPMMSRSVVWTKGKTLTDRLATVQYRFSLETGMTHSVLMGAYLKTLLEASYIVLVMEGLWLISSYFVGKKKTKRLLQPLKQMAETAEELSHIRFDEQKYHELEDAIEALKPGVPDARLSFGDKDLVGLENAVNNLMARMHESYRQQIRFVSDVSHELRTPIAVIQGYTGMLDRWGKGDQKVLDESIAAIKSEAMHMQNMVEQLLFLARGDAGRTPIAREKINLSEMMRSVYEEYEMLDKGHKWRLQRPKEEVNAFGDPTLLKQTVRILADNAVKYSKEGSLITLKCEYTRRGEPSFAVQDNGTGVSAQDLPHLFERFYRADPARGREGGGSGLGLSIAKWIVDRHEGSIDIVSREGVGTRFTVCLPLQQEATPMAEG